MSLLAVTKKKDWTPQFMRAAASGKYGSSSLKAFAKNYLKGQPSKTAPTPTQQTLGNIESRRRKRKTLLGG
jgi:hypothetical protein